MKNAIVVIRIILGAMLIFSGLNKFGHWLNASFMEDAMQFVIDLSNIGAGFAISSIAIIEILLGTAFIINRFSILAQLALLPLIVAILVFHIFLNLNGIGIAVIVLIMDLFLLNTNKEIVKGIFKSKP